MQKIRILYVMETIASGGVEQRRLLSAKWFNPAFYEVKIVCTNAFGLIPRKLNEIGVEIFEIGVFDNLFQLKKYKKLLNIIREFKPHIIHGATFEGFAMAVSGSVFGNIPICILEETSDPQNRSKKANILLKFFVGFSDVIIAISPNVKNYLETITKISSEKISLITNGVRIPEKVSQYDILSKRLELGILNDEIVIGFVGRLDNNHKRMSDLVHALSIVNDNRLKLLIVGTGLDKELVEKIALQLNLSDKVIMVGYQGDTSTFYSIMNVLCVPSSREGFGLVAAEAMLHGLPVIATKVGGLQDIVVDNDTGFLVTPLSPKSIAEKLQILIDQPDLQKKMGERGRKRALSHYTAERYCKEVENLYVELLKKKDIEIDINILQHLANS